ncbi:MAG: hypothetical protein WCL02_09335 [bacterium]
MPYIQIPASIVQYENKYTLKFEIPETEGKISNITFEIEINTNEEELSGYIFSDTTEKQVYTLQK